MNTFTQETLSLFYNETIKGFAECTEQLKTQSERIKILENDLNKITLERAVEQAKNEMRLNVMNDRVIASEQKVNDLNMIMMKHFAYRAELLTPRAEMQRAEISKPRVEPINHIQEQKPKDLFKF